MATESRRSLYRIVYPLSERPTIEIGRSLHDVVDCSEGGIRYTLDHQRTPTVGTRLAGVLHLHSGQGLRVSGIVLRALGGIAVLQLDPPLPFAEMMSEQRYLRSKGFLLKG